MLSMMVMAAVAATSNPVPTVARAAEAAVTLAAPAVAKKAKRYCVKAVVTGSRLPQKRCQSRAEWMKEGFDPTAAN